MPHRSGYRARCARPCRQGAELQGDRAAAGRTRRLFDRGGTVCAGRRGRAQSVCASADRGIARARRRAFEGVPPRQCERRGRDQGCTIAHRHRQLAGRGSLRVAQIATWPGTCRQGKVSHRASTRGGRPVAAGTIYQRPRVAPRPGETVVTSTCGHNCGGRCVVNAHVVDGRITRISSDPAKWVPELPPLQACARGFGQIERVYHPDRLQHPLRRTGPRGSGQFERISWDEALDVVAREMLRVRTRYGNASILDASRSGSLSALHGRTAAQRFLYMFGGCTELWSNMSAEAEIFSVRMTFGAKAVYKSAGREPTDYVNSKLILMWGWSPGDGTFGTGTYQYLRLAKKRGVRIVSIDPRRTRSSAVLADEHVFIQPSTDAAALIAMAYVIASEGLHAAPEGASYRSYLNGLSDGVKKTPEWAAQITGMPAETIRRLAIEFATTKPAALQCGYAPGRTAYGEQFHRAAYALAAMTGNVGIKGGNSGVSNGATGRTGIKSLPAGANPIDARVSSPMLADLLARGKGGGYPADI
ncbi:MAG: hypothetical protein E6G91_20165, partial [Alphaproteobacteria bacterium]